MPTYEYECNNGHTFEVFQRITDEPLKRCKVCRAGAKRLISAANFILKGGGWYADGYSSGNGKRQGGGGEAAGGPSDAAKSESKSKSDSKTSTSSKAGSEAS